MYWDTEKNLRSWGHNMGKLKDSDWKVVGVLILIMVFSIEAQCNVFWNRACQLGPCLYYGPP